MAAAKIVSSTSHISYIARMQDDAGERGETLEFGVFVRIQCGEDEYVGVVCDSRLVNPEYIHNSPMARANPTLGNLSEKLASEQRSLVGILILGWLDAEGRPTQSVPGRMLQLNQDVAPLGPEKVRAFHHPNGGPLEIRYLPSLLANGGSLGGALTDAIISRLHETARDDDRRRLNVVRDSLSWKRSITDVRL